MFVFTLQKLQQEFVYPVEFFLDIQDALKMVHRLLLVLCYLLQSLKRVFSSPTGPPLTVQRALKLLRDQFL